MVGQIASGVAQDVNHRRGRFEVRVSDPEGDDFYALGALLGDLATDFNEQVWGYLLDSAGEIM